MARARRRVLVALGITAAAFFVVIAAVLLWLSWPNSSTLTGYAARGDLAGVRRCLRLGVDPNHASRYGFRHENEADTPLTAAAASGQVEVIRVLLEHGADPNLRDFGADMPHETPLASAARAGHLEACRVLLEAGADPNIPSYPKGRNWTALDFALDGDHTEVVALLRQHGARQRPPAITDVAIAK